MCTTSVVPSYAKAIAKRDILPLRENVSSASLARQLRVQAFHEETVKGLKTLIRRCGGATALST